MEFQPYQIITHKWVEMILEFIFQAKSRSLSQYVCISSLQNYYSCISRPLIYAHQIISLWNSFFKPRAASTIWLNNYSCKVDPWFCQIISLWNSFLLLLVFLIFNLTKLLLMYDSTLDLVINLWNSFFMPSAASNVWISTLPNVLLMLIKY